MNCEEESSKFRKVLKKELARRNSFKIVNMGTDSNVVCTLVASSLAKKIQVARQVSVCFCYYLPNFLANKNSKAWATLGISNSDHHREQPSVLPGSLLPFSGMSFLMLVCSW